MSLHSHRALPSAAQDRLALVLNAGAQTCTLPDDGPLVELPSRTSALCKSSPSVPRPSVPSPDSTLAASELPLYTEQPLDHNHGHEAPRLPQRGSWMSRMLVGVVVMLCCGLMVLCIALAVAVGGYKIEQRGGGLLDGTPLFAHAHLTVDTAASPPPPARELLRLPSRIANQLHRIRQIEILDGQLDEASLRRVFPHWWDTDGALQSAVAMADVVTALAHLSLLLSPITESES